MDMKKIIKQHQQMENFFSGGFMVKEDFKKLENKKTELETIANQVHQCRKCELGSLRTNAVPGEGDPNALIMFIGEGPGADEDAQGRPFVGRAGQLLDKIIVYTKKPGSKTDYNAPLGLPMHSTVKDVAKHLHKDFEKKLRFARIWGAARFPGQRGSKDYELKNRDIVEVFA